MTKEQIFTELKGMMVKLFELDPEDIKLESTLFEELELDSIDAVDVIVMLQKRTGKKMSPEDFKAVRTVGDVVDAIYRLVNEAPADGPADPGKQ